MTTTIAKGRMFRVTVTTDEARLERMRQAPAAAQAALAEGAEYWQTGILPEHFKRSAHDRYGYARRALSYLKQRNKKGNAADLYFSGSMKRDLMGRSALQKSGSSVQLKLYARVLNLAPAMPQNSFALYVKQGRKTGMLAYPNLKREVKVVLEDEREAIAAVVARRLEMAFGNTEGAESDD